MTSYIILMTSYIILITSYQHMILMVFAVWYTLSMPALDQKPMPGDTWPPPPTVSTSAALPERRADWFRPALWLGLAFNLLACWPALELLNEPYGSEQMSDDLDAWPHAAALFVAGLAFLVGFPIVIWQIRKRQKYDQSVVLEWFALASCLTPYPVACAVLSVILSAKAFDSLG